MSFRRRILLCRAATSLLGFALLPTSGGLAVAQSSPTAPTLGVTALAPTADYFTDAFADPLDYANPEDQLFIPSAHEGTAPRLEGGALRFERTGTANIAFVWAGYAPGALAAGREGLATPIDADQYTKVSFRARSPKRNAASISWDRCGPDAGRCMGSADLILDPGWNTYTLTLAGRPGWTGDVVELRLNVAGDPTGPSEAFALDWARVHTDGNAVPLGYTGRTLHWDVDADRANNTPDNPNWGVVASGGGNAMFAADAYPAGTYRFYADNGPASAPLEIGAPLPVILDPDFAGGADYATTVNGNPWDFDGPGDLLRHGNILTTDFSGGVLRGTNIPGPGDPWFILPQATPIDLERFHRLTVRATLDGAFDLGFAPGGGTHGRVLWRTVDQPADTFIYNSKELVVYPGVPSYTVDLHTDPRSDVAETDDARRTGWTGLADVFRYDPNEDPGARGWTVDAISLRADDEAVGNSFDVRWRDGSATAQDGTTVALYADADGQGFDGRLIADGLAQQPSENVYRWDTRGFPAGRYSLYMVGERGGIIGRRYATGPIVVPDSGGAEVPVPAPSAPPADDPAVADARVAGADRIETAVKLSGIAFPAQAPAAVVASGGEFPDALAAAPLAAAAGGPVLLNPGDRLDDRVSAELDRLGAARVYLMGGERAQSGAVAQALEAKPGVEVVRISGANRFATAAAAAELAVDLWRAAGDRDAGKRGVLVASGRNFPDALAAGPFAAASHRPLLLADPAGVPPETGEALDRLRADEAIIVGGPAALGEAAAAQLAEGGRAVRRIFGPSRYATGGLLAEAAIEAGADPDVVLVAAGSGFADALAAGPAAAARGGVLLLTDRAALPEETSRALTARDGTIRELRVAGGAAAVSDNAVREALTAAGRP